MARPTAPDPILAEVDGGPAVLKASSIWEQYDSSVDYNPNHPAVMVYHQTANHLSELFGSLPPNLVSKYNSFVCTYGQMRRATFVLIHAFIDLGVRKGDKIITFIPNGIEWCLLWWVSVYMKLTFVPLDMHILEGDRGGELEYYFRTLQPAVVVVNDSSMCNVVHGMKRKLSITTGVGIYLHRNEAGNDHGILNWKPFSDFGRIASHEENANAFIPSSDSMDRTASIIFTSGTSSGNPKGCPTMVSNALHQIHNEFGVWGLDRSTRFVVHTANFRAICNQVSSAVWAQGGTIVMAPTPFTAAGSIAAIKKFCGTMMANVPYQIYSFAREMVTNSDREQCKTLKQVYIGGDVVTEQVILKGTSTFPNANVGVAHGMTEGCAVFGRKKGGDWVEHPFFQEIGTPGKPLSGVKIKVLGQDGEMLRRGEIGELHISSKCCIEKYLDNIRPELFYQQDEDQWLVTGDKAIIDDEGYVFIVGRSKDIMKRAGVPIAPAAIEACLARKLDIQAEVVGIPHQTLGENPYAIVADLPPDVNPEDIKTTILSSFGKDFALGGIVTLKQLGMTAWPMNPSGKVPKLDLKKAVVKFMDNKST